MISTSFDTYLFLEDSAGNVLIQDDDSGGNLNARILYEAPKEGEYRIIATTLFRATGEFTLTVRSTAATEKETEKE